VNHPILLKYLGGYSPAVQAQVRGLIAQDRLGVYLHNRYGHLGMRNASSNTLPQAEKRRPGFWLIPKSTANEPLEALEAGKSRACMSQC
jgi:hypothetical protein